MDEWVVYATGLMGWQEKKAEKENVTLGQTRPF